MESIGAKALADKKLITLLLFFLFYLFLYLTPGAYSIRFIVGALFPFFILALILKNSKNKLNYFLSIAWIFIVLATILLTSLIPWSYTVFVGDSEIRSTVNELVSGVLDSEKVEKIMEWERFNMTGMYKKPRVILEIPLIWYRDENPSWIFFYKRGNCEEFAILFVKMADLAGIQSKRVRNPAEDHNWAEVFIDNSWTPVDPANAKFINPENYENERGIQMSYVYALENGQVIDITSQYTDTGKLIVQVLRENRPVTGARITIRSKALMEKDSYYDSPREIVGGDKQIFLTNENGIFVINLGGNNYSIAAEVGGYKVENNVTIEENKDNPLTLSFSQ